MDTITNSDTSCVQQTKNISNDGEPASETRVHDRISPVEINHGESTGFGFGDAATVDITPDKSGGVLKKILNNGEGEDYPGFGDRVFVHYTGWLLNKEPVVFDSNVKEERFEFNLGRGMVIKGWDLGIGTMKKGEVALFICHPNYAYGEMGYPPTIPPRTPLLFEIKLFDWKLEDLSPKKDESILRKVLKKGEGNIFPNEGSEVKVQIIRYNDDGIPFEDEKDFILGEGCVVDIPEGLEIALLKFTLKEKSLIYLKNKYAEDIKTFLEMSYNPDEVKYEVTLLHFEKAKSVWEMNSDEKFEKARISKEKGVKFFNMALYKVALRCFKWIVTCLEDEPGVSPENQNSRKSLLLSGYLNTALCHQKLGNHTDVIKVCSKALLVDPGNEKALFRRGQAKVAINDCEEALSDFQNLCTLKPDNKAVQNYISVCQNKMKKQLLKDKNTYNNMFELFVKQDEERLKNMKTETGVWQSEENEDSPDGSGNHSESLLNENSRALLDANIIELSNTANGHVPYKI